MTLIVPRRHWPGFGRRRRGGGPSGGPIDPRPRYAKYHGFHADEDNGIESIELLRGPFAACDVNPETESNGAMALWRHLDASHYAEMLPQRQVAAAYGFETPTIVFVYFTNSDPGTNDPAENDAALLWLADQVALYAGENIIAAWGNVNGSNWMPGASAAARNAAAWAMEARAISEVFIPAGVRWAVTNDMGIVSLAQTAQARTDAWRLELIEPDDCEFFCDHSYVNAGFVPSHIILAEQSLARCVPPILTPIRVTECAYGFLGVGFTRAEKPWLFRDDPLGTAHPQALTWTRLIFEWFRTTNRHMLLFDWTMLLNEGGTGLSTWGDIFASDQHNQPAFVLPVAGTLWSGSSAPLKGGQIALSNSGDPGLAQGVRDWIADGNYFTVGVGTPASEYDRTVPGDILRTIPGGATRTALY